ncbi:hypothetical protein [Niallia taxi]|uniref:hypothetical protein n=1 Tax=Niallia taxi TaxID=2499688 RepID=UPI003D285CB1
MGFKRFMKKGIVPFYNARDMIDKVQTHGFVDGIKEKIREDFLEDAPIISHIYNAGKHEGKKDGYRMASTVYEKKMFAQANSFLKQKEIFESQKKEYEQLLQDYENYIEEMNAKDHLTNEEQENLLQIISIEHELKKLVV